MSRIDSIISTAKDYLGTKEGDSSHKEIIDLYNDARYSDAYKMTMNDPWCCAFVVAVFQKCGMADIIPCYAACDQMISIFSKWRRYQSRSVHNVKAGDIVFYDWNGDGSSDHVGIVIQNNFGKLAVIEGNKSDSVSYRNINSLDRNIIGYGSPNYDASGNDSTGTVHDLDSEYIRTLPVLSYGSKGLYVKILQVLLNYYNDAHLDIDGDFGSATRSAVTQYQEKSGINVDGVASKQTWSQLLLK